MGYDAAVAEAQRVFRLMCPTEEFLPAAPNPEDIVFDFQTDNDDEDEPRYEEEIFLYRGGTGHLVGPCHALLFICSAWGCPPLACSL